MYARMPASSALAYVEDRDWYQDRFLNCFSTLFFKTGPLTESGSDSFARESLGLDQDHPVSTLNRRGGEDGGGADKDV